MLSVSRVRPIQTASEGERRAGDALELGQDRGVGDADVVDPRPRLVRQHIGHPPAQHLGRALAGVVRVPAPR